MAAGGAGAIEPPEMQRHGRIKEGTPMKVVILAGVIRHQNQRGKPFKAEADGGDREQPILWHIMKYYSQFGYHDFVICLGL